MPYRPNINKEIVNCYKEYLGEDLVSLILFGSRARGEARAASDYDLFIINKSLPQKPYKRVQFIRKPLKGQFEERLCIIAKTPEEVLSDLPAFFLDLGLDAVIIFDRDDFFQHLQAKIKDIIHQAGLQRKKYDGDYYWEWENPPKRAWEITWGGYREL